MNSISILKSFKQGISLKENYTNLKKKKVYYKHKLNECKIPNLNEGKK